jgi:vitamin K-dependent gamma-carboxylase
MNGRFTGFLLHRFHQPWITWLSHDQRFHVFIAWGGILFDMFIVPLLLYRKTRNIGALLSVGFHLFNWLMLNIGIFPFLSLSYLVFFFPPDRIRAFFLRKKAPLTDDELCVIDKGSKNLMYYFFFPYFLIQLALPVRHHFIKGDVLWTEEGHFLSWRMMLKNKKGSAIFVVKDRSTGQSSVYNLSKLLTKLQIQKMNTKPSMIWQTAQFIRKEYAEKGQDVEVYVTAKSSVNKRKSRLLIDPEIDLAHAKWDYFGHNDWILLYDK